ncbi:MAG: isoprenyl transferase [Tidjanibacter sp.]|nr:isoprenyl transferase [Tidjanibacter sp.]
MKSNRNIPQHIAIIMDGNGRWAKARGLERTEGHIAGVESVRRAISSAAELGIKYLTLYTFSTENWGRPKEEVDALMALMCKCVQNEEPELVKQGVQMRFIGLRSGLPEEVRESITHIEAATANCNTLTVILALNYSSRSEITEAAKELARKAVSGEINPEEIDSRMVDDALFTQSFPDPDLIIRTGGEYRLSNFLLWQGAYAELYFTPTLWPDFGKKSLAEAIDAFGGRDRRYGKLSEQEE